jgi:N-acetylmuramoyl-L-alanine amidase
VPIDVIQRALGGSIEWGESGFSVTFSLEGGTLQFEDRIPFFSFDQRPYQLIDPPLLWRDKFLIPLQLITEYVPYFYPDVFSYDTETSTLMDRRFSNFIQGMKRSVDDDETEIFFHSSSPPRFDIDTSKPGTFLLNVFETRNSHPLTDSLQAFGYIDSTHVTELDGSTQFLFYLNPYVRRYRAAEVKDPPGISIVFSGERLGVKKEETKERKIDQISGTTDRREFLIRTVIIDPGHGGKDPGAIGRSGLMEKEVNLKVAMKLESILKKKMDLRVIMTRRKDTYISLKKRAELANSNKGDESALFISIHCNSSKKKDLRGFEAYFLSVAKTDEERAVAHRENLSDQLYESPVDSGELADLPFIMVDLMQTAYLEDSSEYAAIMSSEFNDGSRIISRGLRQAGFFVLNGAHMPSILLELGYISNSIEEELLGDNDYQDELARRIYGGIESCIERNHRRFDQ